jgi:hypothetical protein
LSVRGSSEKVFVELGRPYAHGDDFSCPFTIAFGANSISREIFAVDAFQALELAVRTISVNLHYEKSLPLGRRYWLDPKKGLGFVNPEQGK